MLTQQTIIMFVHSEIHTYWSIKLLIGKMNVIQVTNTTTTMIIKL